MKDIDFDELDRAVNSLMTNVPKSEPSKDEDHIKTLDITSTLAPGAVPKFSTLDTSSSPQDPAAMPESTTPPSHALSLSPRPTTSSVAARRGGRFMDVVHPSSDMKPRPAVPVSRQGVTITPEQADLTAPQESAASSAPAPVSSSSAPTVEQTHTEPVNEWPDPLDMVDFEQPTTPEKADLPEAPVTVKPEESPVVTSEAPNKKDDTDVPLTTPFLTGTKVEKRPLGGSAPATIEEPDHTPVLAADTLNTGSVNDPNDQLPALPKDVEPLLPAELQGDLMAIEADNGADVPTPDAEPSTMPKSNESKKEMTPPAKPGDAKGETLAMSGGPTSIPQQYREEPSTGDTVSGAIYDTDTYHQPLSHPVKKKSGWLWVVWILLIVLVGAGIGAALFFFGVV